MDDTILAKAHFKYNRPGARQKAARNALLAVCGLFIGAVNGLFGAGGGMLAVPVLTFVAGLDERRSHATAIAVILPLCLISTVVYAVKGSYDLNVLAPTIGGVVLGGAAGALLLKKANNVFLNLMFYGLMVFAGLKMLMK